VNQLRIENLRGIGFGPVDLSLTGGECLCLSGPSGAGKSRLLRAIADLDPHDGQLALDGISSAAVSPTDWRRRIGLLPAESGWWSERVADHFPGNAPGEAFERLGLAADVLEQAVEHLSSGERQRLALLRLLANRPQALLLDEPTANLDPANTERVEALLAETCRRGAILLWVSHDLNQIARVANQHWVMKNGRVHPANQGHAV
jgi:ABC-type iron transport system FetAB ATPase subunit